MEITILIVGFFLGVWLAMISIILMVASAIKLMYWLVERMNL